MNKVHALVIQVVLVFQKSQKVNYKGPLGRYLTSCNEQLRTKVL